MIEEKKSAKPWSLRRNNILPIYVLPPKIPPAMAHLPFLFSLVFLLFEIELLENTGCVGLIFLWFYYVASIETFYFFPLFSFLDCLTSIRAYRLHQQLAINNHEDKTIYNPIFSYPWTRLLLQLARFHVHPSCLRRSIRLFPLVVCDHLSPPRTRRQWQTRSPVSISDLKICGIACPSSMYNSMRLSSEGGNRS